MLSFRDVIFLKFLILQLGWFYIKKILNCKINQGLILNNPAVLYCFQSLDRQKSSHSYQRGGFK
jgi:hypothetical protein